MDSDPVFNVWVTKYALTTGIEQYADARQCLASSPNGNMIQCDGLCSPCFHGEGRDWHRTRESAVKRAEAMRTKKIASLKKQILALEKLRF